MLSLIKIIIAKSEIFWPHCEAMHGKTRATRASPCLLPSAQRATEKQQCKWRYQKLGCAVLEKTDLVSFQARDDWDFTFNMIKIKKWCSWRKGKEKDKKGRKTSGIFCEMAVLQLFCIILVSSSTVFINDVSAAYSCPIRDEAFELVTGKIFYPTYVLTENLRNALESKLWLRKTCQFYMYCDLTENKILRKM